VGDVNPLAVTSTVKSGRPRSCPERGIGPAAHGRHEGLCPFSTILPRALPSALTQSMFDPDEYAINCPSGDQVGDVVPRDVRRRVIPDPSEFATPSPLELQFSEAHGQMP